VLDPVDRDRDARVVGVQLDDLAAIARAVEPRVDAGERGAGAGVEVDAAVDEAMIAVVEDAVAIGDLLLARGDRRDRDRRQREAAC
jgi:hypothetical protein